jgi:acetyltransferase-like isoleucine patch superfamily enzyme
VPSRLWEFEARLRGAEIRGPVTFLGRPILTVFPGSTLIFEGKNEIFSSLRGNPLGNAQPCVLRTLAPGARLVLALNVGMSSAVLCAEKEIVIGEGTIIGAGAMLLDNDFHSRTGSNSWGPSNPQAARAISIGKGCFIGARAIILKGVTLGDGVVVGAGAVVSKSCESGTLVGNPAMPIRSTPAV